MTLHWQILWTVSGGSLHLVFAVSPKVIMPWSCLVDLLDDQYTVGGNTWVMMLKLFNWVQFYEVLLL
jgi:hypothetical protein